VVRSLKRRDFFEVFHQILAGEDFIAEAESIVDTGFVDELCQCNTSEKNKQTKEGKYSVDA